MLVILFALLGVQIFGGKFNYYYDGKKDARGNFDSFWQALITVFQVSLRNCVISVKIICKINSRWY